MIRTLNLSVYILHTLIPLQGLQFHSFVPRNWSDCFFKTDKCHQSLITSMNGQGYMKGYPKNTTPNNISSIKKYFIYISFYLQKWETFSFPLYGPFKFYRYFNTLHLKVSVSTFSTFSSGFCWDVLLCSSFRNMLCDAYLQLKGAACVLTEPGDVL